MQRVPVAIWSELGDRLPIHALVANVDLVVLRYDQPVSVLFGRCHHRGALLADGHVEGENLICGLHGWDDRYRSGVSEYNDAERLARFASWIEDHQVWVGANEIAAWEREHPQLFERDAYLGSYQDAPGTPEGPHVGSVHERGPRVFALVFMVVEWRGWEVFDPQIGETLQKEAVLQGLVTMRQAQRNAETAGDPGAVRSQAPPRPEGVQGRSHRRPPGQSATNHGAAPEPEEREETVVEETAGGMTLSPIEGMMKDETSETAVGLWSDRACGMLL